MPIKKTITIVEAPSNLGLMPPAPGKTPGVNYAPAALKTAQLANRLRAQDGGGIEAPIYNPQIEPEIGIRNAAAIRGYSTRLAEAVGRVVKTDRFALVLGGDCSILLGTALALRKLGRYGLVFIDGHTDFHTPQTTRSGGVAGMDLALATGNGPELLTNIGGLKPYIRETDTVLLGNRDIADPRTYPAKHIFGSQVQMIPLDSLRALGIDSVIQQTLQKFEISAVSGFFIHLDVDVIDSTVMPAVDSPMPGGLSYIELGRILRGLLASDLVVGMEITIYDPDRDPDGSAARDFVSALVHIFGAVYE
ncbi:MAG: arginase family protein [Anaerolineae bacterium]|nr:arginase family protein [Anaerolineae bacterium]